MRSSPPTRAKNSNTAIRVNRLNTKVITAEYLSQAAQALRDGGTVVFPTETVYGLGADGLNDAAVGKIYEAKGRPGDNPLIIHIADKADVAQLVREIPPAAQLLMQRYWPGPLTLIFPKSERVGQVVTAGLDTVAVRMPSNRIARALIRESGVYVAAPSANLSGSPSPTTVEHVIDDLDGRVNFIIDGTGCEIGLESTVVDVSVTPPVLLRPGAVTLEELRELLPDIVAGRQEEENAPKCPGMKYTHYAPKAQVTVVYGPKGRRQEYIKECLKGEPNAGVLTYRGGCYEDAKLVIDAGESMQAYASGLFANLRNFDTHQIRVIYAEFEQAGGMGRAVQNRLYKAAGYRVINLYEK